MAQDVVEVEEWRQHSLHRGFKLLLRARVEDCAHVGVHEEERLEASGEASLGPVGLFKLGINVRLEKLDKFVIIAAT